jgi:hypothetical protein
VLVSVGSLPYNAKVLDLEQESQDVSHVGMVVHYQDRPTPPVIDSLGGAIGSLLGRYVILCD